MAVGRRDDVHRVDAIENGVVIIDGPCGCDSVLYGPRPSTGRNVGHPHGGAKLAEHAKALFAPTAQPDEENVRRLSHRRGRTGMTPEQPPRGPGGTLGRVPFHPATRARGRCRRPRTRATVRLTMSSSSLVRS